MASLSFGFVISRCMKERAHERFWKQCVFMIRLHHPFVPIYIIDDHSSPERIIGDATFLLSDTNTTIIPSKYQAGIGEILPYLYLLEYKWFDVSICMHDTVFLHRPVDASTVVSLQTVRFLWGFTEKPEDFIKYGEGVRQGLSISGIDPTLYQAGNIASSRGCFGVMSMIRTDFLVKLVARFPFLTLYGPTRFHRMCFERIFALACYVMLEGNVPPAIFHDDLHTYTNNPYNINFDQYITSPFLWTHLPAMKVVAGR